LRAGRVGGRHPGAAGRDRTGALRRRVGRPPGAGRALVVGPPRLRALVSGGLPRLGALVVRGPPGLGSVVVAGSGRSVAHVRPWSRCRRRPG
jgi:hypothetical protein